MKRTMANRLMAMGTFAGFMSAVVPTVAVTALMLHPADAMAQDLTSGTLVGHISSDDGKPVSGAQVTIVSDSGIRTSLTSNANGEFRLSQVPIGKYSVTISAAGYQGGTDDNVSVRLGSVSNYNFSIKQQVTTVDAVTVAVKAVSPSVDFDRQTTGAVLDVQQEADRLPVARNIQGIVSIAPQTKTSEVFGQPSIAGSSAAENIYYLNGMNLTNFRNFLGANTVPFEFYDQVEIKTGGYAAEFGRSTGGAVIAVSRKGSNTFHGGFNAFSNPQFLRSNSPAAFGLSTKSGSQYDNSYSLGRESESKSDEANVWLSGPIVKDRLFFFGFYNYRNLYSVSESYTSTTDAPNVVVNKTEPDVYDEYSTKNPFYGARLDFVIFDGHRLEYTYFRDTSTLTDKNFVSDGAGAYSGSSSFNFSGGITNIYKYTGRLTDWFTLSALYGRSGANQTSKGELDDQAGVYDSSLGGLVRGNPSLLIASGADERINSRVDADIYATWHGDHHIRIGYDLEQLTATQAQQYSGGTYYRFYPSGTNCGSTGFISTPSVGCVRVRRLNNIGSFDIVNQGLYVQDSWNVSDRLNIQAGLRNEDFNNKNAGGDSFVHLKDQLAPRLGATFDLRGDKKSKLTAFFGQYYLPVAGNTNIRGSGGEIFLQDYYKYSSRDATTLVPVLGERLLHQCLEGIDDGANCNPEYPPAATLASQNINPQYMNEYIGGYQRNLDNGWTVGVNLIYRDLKSVLEDANLNDPLKGDVSPYCAYAHISADDCGSFGNGGYVLINPGRDVVVELNSSWGALEGTTVTIPKSVVGLPQAKRTYQAAEFTFSRPWDGRWSLDGSYVLSKTYGNYEGGVKSDNGQADTGGTQDFDEPGWMQGANGLLPTHRAHTFKLRGNYQLTENLRLGGQGTVISPRHYGCIGYYPKTDGLADRTTLTAWYCDSIATPRGSVFKGPWIKNVDLSLTYDLPTNFDLPGSVADKGKAQFRVDVFNVFNEKNAETQNEFGETGGVGTLNYAYRKGTSFQTPRYVRAGVVWGF